MSAPALREWINKNTVAKAIGKSRRTVDRMVEAGELPPPVSSRGHPVWDKAEVAEWQQKQIDNRNEAAARLQENESQEAA